MLRTPDDSKVTCPTIYLSVDEFVESHLGISMPIDKGCHTTTPERNTDTLRELENIMLL